jgi:hypothetical protein
MNRKTKINLAVAGLALAALACQAIASGGEDPAEVDPNAPTSTPSPRVIFSDDFAEQTWGTGTDSDSSVEYANEALQMIVYPPNWFVWSTPNTEEYQNIHVEVSVTNNDTDSTTAFGIMCHQQDVRDNFYYFAVTPAGEYAIARASEGQKDVFLTNEDQWAVSELIPQEVASYRVGADCGNGTLTLYVDGQEIASVSDSSYISGGVALFTFSGEEAATTDVSFDDFLIMELP